MKEILNKSIVLILNRNWQAIDTATPVEVFGHLANDSAAGLDIQEKDWMVPVTWEDALLRHGCQHLWAGQ